MNYVKRVVIDTCTLISAAIRVHSIPSLAYQKALQDYENMFLELALSSTADLIISSDPDLYILNPYQNIAIVQPAVFLQNH